MEVISCVRSKVGLSIVVVPKDGDVVVVVGTDDVGWDGLDPDGVRRVVLTGGLILSVQVSLSWFVFFEEASVLVGTGNASRIIHDDGIGVATRLVVVNILIVVVEGEANGTVRCAELLENLSPPLNGSRLHH